MGPTTATYPRSRRNRVGRRAASYTYGLKVQTKIGRPYNVGDPRTLVIAPTLPASSAVIQSRTGRRKHLCAQGIHTRTLVIWQASHSGRYNHKGDAENQDFQHPKTGEVIKRTLDPSFQYWGRALTNRNGEYQFKTIVPGFYPADLQGGWYRPPHIHFLITATGFPQFVTQMYFSGEKIIDNDWIQELNKKDFLLQSNNISNEQRQNLVVEFKTDLSGAFADGLIGTFNITLTR